MLNERILLGQDLNASRSSSRSTTRQHTDANGEGEAPPGACEGRLFSFTKDVRSHGCGKSCWSEFSSASTSCRAAHLWPVEEASFSSSVAWSSCEWEAVSSTSPETCNQGKSAAAAAGVRSSSGGRDGGTRTWELTGDRSDSGDFFGDLFTLKVLLRRGQFVRVQQLLNKTWQETVRWRLLLH